MDVRNTEKYAHEFKSSKLEHVVASIKTMASEKIDLVEQKVVIPMDSDDDPRTTFYIRFWRLAEGTVSLQQVPLSEKELERLADAILSHFQDVDTIADLRAEARMDRILKAKKKLEKIAWDDSPSTEVPAPTPQSETVPEPESEPLPAVEEAPVEKSVETEGEANG